MSCLLAVISYLHSRCVGGSCQFCPAACALECHRGHTSGRCHSLSSSCRREPTASHGIRKVHDNSRHTFMLRRTPSTWAVVCQQQMAVSHAPIGLKKAKAQLTCLSRLLPSPLTCTHPSLLRQAAVVWPQPCCQPAASSVPRHRRAGAWGSAPCRPDPYCNQLGS